MKKKFLISVLLSFIFIFSGIAIGLTENNADNSTENINKSSKVNQENEVVLSDGEHPDIAINITSNGHKEVIIVAPGWFMCKDSAPFLEMAEDFSKDFDVISMDFRGHCKSEGSFTFTSNEFIDLNKVINYAREKYKKVYVIGFSLGSATAVINQSINHNADKLILVSAPVNFDMIENQFWKKEAFIPTIQKFEMKTWVNILPGKFWLKKVEPIRVIKSIKNTPILFMAGEDDKTIYYWQTEELYKKANEPKKFILYKNRIHAEDIYMADKKEFIKTCTDFLKKSSY